jgi:polyisoprenoid-binding protein YceI
LKRVLFPSLLAALAIALPAAAELETYTIDPRHTLPTYEVSHFGYSLQRGRFTKVSGKIEIDIAAGTGSVDASIDAASVSSGIDKLDEHLRSDEFFDVGNYPQITFKSDHFTFEGDRLVSVTGDLTMRGVTRPVTLTANVFKCARNLVLRMVCGADLVATVKRSEFGMTFLLPGLGNEVTLRIPVEATKD